MNGWVRLARTIGRLRTDEPRLDTTLRLIAGVRLLTDSSLKRGTMLVLHPDDLADLKLEHVGPINVEREPIDDAYIATMRYRLDTDIARMFSRNLYRVTDA